MRRSSILIAAFVLFLLSASLARAACFMWKELGIDSIDGHIYSVAKFGDYIYIGGSFDTINGENAPGIARGKDGVWSSLSLQLSDGAVVRAMTVYNGALYVGGDFAKAGAVDVNDVPYWLDVNNIARWNGSGWLN